MRTSPSGTRWKAATDPAPTGRAVRMSAARWTPRLVAAAILGSALLLSAQAPATLPYRDPTLPVDARVRDLLSRMTLEEKFWQLFMIPGDLDTPANDYSLGIFGLQVSTGRSERSPAASPGAIARAHAEHINAIQRYFVE